MIAYTHQLSSRDKICYILQWNLVTNKKLKFSKIVP